MNCPKCGAQIVEGAVFCVNCGLPLNNGNLNQNINSQIEPPPIVANSIPESSQSMSNQVPVQGFQPVNNVAKVSTSTLNYFMYLIAVLLKPFQSYKEESKINNDKTPFILTLIVIVIMTLAKLVQTIFSTIRVMDYSFTTGYGYTWKWDNLQNVNWVTVIGKNLIINVGIVLGIALVFYLGSLIIKKQLNFIKSLTISVTSVIPAVVGAMILSPILSLIWKPLGVCISIIGIVYSLIILYELVNDELILERDKKIYFNLVCFGILLIIGYYIYIKLFMSSATSGLDNILNLFN